MEIARCTLNFYEIKGIRILGEIMKQRIDIKWSKEKLDSFLKEKYGYGIWEFELSLYQTYVMYSHGLRIRYDILEGKRIRQLRNLKRRILELIDKYLSDINFYKYSLKGTLPKNLTGISKWTSENREKFIRKKFKIEQLFFIVDELIEHQIMFEALSEMDALLWGVEWPMRLKPPNFLILIWSSAMKKGKKPDWINMENLLNWFSKNLDEVNILDFFGLEKCNAPSSETLRLTRNKYKSSKYDKLASSIYMNNFKNVKEKKRKYPKIINAIKVLYGGKSGMDDEVVQGFHDIISCLVTLFPDYFGPFDDIQTAHN